MKLSFSAFADRLLGPILGVVALGVYLATLSDGVCPGESASLVVQTIGLMPAMAPGHPLWHALAFLGAAIAGKGAVAFLNGLNAVCGGVTVWLMFEVVSRVVSLCIEEDEEKRALAKAASWLAGAAAALSLAFCVPFWIVSNRAHTAAFDVMWLLLTIFMFVRYFETGRWRWALTFAFLYGLGVVEFATFIILAPLLGGLLLVLMWKKEDLRTGRLLQLLPAAVAGLLLYFATAWQFYGSKGYLLRDYAGFWHVLWILWRDQYFMITRSLPQRGWLVIVVVAVLPWLTALAVARRALNEEKDWTYYILHAIMTALATAVLLNFRLAPWPMLGESLLLVTPYVLTASLFGYLAAYWVMLPAAWRLHDDETWRRRLRLLSSVAIGAVFALLPLVVPFLNRPQTDARSGRWVNHYAEQVVSSLSGRRWLVTDGSIDPFLRIVAWRRGLPLHLVNLGAANSTVYTRYIAQYFTSPRYRNLAQIGMMPMLTEWFETDRTVVTNTALMAAPELWSAAKATPLPYKMLTLGAPTPDAIKAQPLMQAHEQFWTEEIPPLRRAAASAGNSAALARHLLGRAAFTANNLGVLMEDLGRPADAFRSYSMAQEIDTNNISALLNMETMIRKGFKTERAEAVHRDLTNAVATLDLRRVRLWALSQYFGTVRAPEAFAESGWTWALSGRPGLAASGILRAIEMSPAENKDAFRQMLAGLYMNGEREEDSEAIYRALLIKDPRNLGALLSLSRMAMRKGDFEEAETNLARAAEAGLPKPATELQRAQLLIARGESAAARARLEALTKDHPTYLDAWILLGGLLALQDDDTALESCLQKLGDLKGGRGFAAAIRADVALRRNDLEGGRSALDEALQSLPGNRQILERLIRLDMTQNQLDQAAGHARQILRKDPEHAQANFVLGHVQLLNREYDLAEDSLRRSIRAGRTPRALNDLAWLLTERGRLDEAEKLAREAVALNPSLSAAHDTLGVVLMRNARFDDAEKVLDQALELSQLDLGVFMHMAELQARKGNAGRAREIVDMLYEKIDQLSASQQEDLTALTRLVDESAARKKTR